MQGLRHCYSAAVKWCQASVKGECNYGGQGHCRMELMKDALALLEPKAARLLSEEEFKDTPFGMGWLENMFEWDTISLERFAWVNGSAVSEVGYTTVEKLLRLYNISNGVRVWVGDVPPTDEQRRAKEWR